ncbi:hypothetical protein L3Y34_019460 [Caenorhabditis briggsae]|uniref:Uncharacterized protein n=1 Tax=Caenorhabditis briggsae TaxID=6238 RepID=A0AAE9DP64_CAEBR|nr:hypothetical protein L3Y34_019460 [Caenorhabditis briggsae]
MNEQRHHKPPQPPPQQQRDRTNTVYYDAQSNFGTPPNADGIVGISAAASSAKDYKDYKMGLRKASGSSDRGAGGGGGDDVLYERVHTERRHHLSTSSSSPYPHRPSSREQQHSRPSHQSTVIHHQIRSPSSATSSGTVIMAPMSSSYDYSVGSSASPSAFRAQSEVAGSQWAPRAQEDFRPGPRASSAANIDALFAPKGNQRTQSTSSGVPRLQDSGSRMTAGGYDPSANIVYTRRTGEPSRGPRDPPKDYSVVGAYERSHEQPIYSTRGPPTTRGSVRQHSNEYELDPRLNVTYPQFYVDDWKERHHNPRGGSAAGTPQNSGYPRGAGAPRHSPSFTTTTGHQMTGRPRFGSEAGVGGGGNIGNTSRHLYEEVPMGVNGYRSPSGYGMKETAILDDYDNVPSEFLEENRAEAQRKKKDEEMSTKDDGGSAIYQPGRYQPC